MKKEKIYWPLVSIMVLVVLGTAIIGLSHFTDMSDNVFAISGTILFLMVFIVIGKVIFDINKNDEELVKFKGENK